MPDLAIASDKVCGLIYRLRQRQGKISAQDVAVDEADDGPGSNEAEDEFLEIIEDLPDDAVEDEIRGVFEALNDDERVDLLALMWIGRGDFGPEELDTARQEAADHVDVHEADYMLGTPLVADYLESALNEFGFSCRE